MINSLYELTKKGWLTALSFIFASGMFGLIIFKSTLFAQYFGGKIPYLALLVLYAMAILWIHGVGFEIRKTVWKVVFMPLVGYLILIPSILILLSA
ncbi:cyd operon protein YbgE [Pasteurellaceae bacterium 15-036681]|nr:cyd operon protein YbgE [Pasteurellaceae bacterium 15-036681]